MLLTRHQTQNGPRWALDGNFLPPSLTLGALLELPRAAMFQVLTTLINGEAAYGEMSAPTRSTKFGRRRNLHCDDETRLARAG